MAAAEKYINSTQGSDPVLFDYPIVELFTDESAATPDGRGGRKEHVEYLATQLNQLII